MYLINVNSPDSAGDYDDDTARVLLVHAVGWQKADPPPPPPPEAPTGDKPADPTNNGESAETEGN